MYVDLRKIFAAQNVEGGGWPLPWCYVLVFFKCNQNWSSITFLWQFFILEEGIMCHWNKCSDLFISYKACNNVTTCALARECGIIILDIFNCVYCFFILRKYSFNSFCIRGIDKGYHRQCYWTSKKIHQNILSVLPYWFASQ